MSDEWDDALAPALTARGNGQAASSAAPPPATTSGGGAPAGQPDQPQPVYPDVEAWVTDWFAQIIRRPRIKGWRWCPQWWQHPEAIDRLEALWRAWEALRLDGTTGMSVWWRDHCDPHLAALTDQDRSPFKQCSEERGHVGEDEPLPVEPAPSGFWGT